MITPEIYAKINRKLLVNESIVWVGKPIACAFSKYTIGLMLFGIPWSAISFTICALVMHSIWLVEGGTPIEINGTPTTVAEMSIWIKLGMTAFFIPFITIGLCTLLAPLWYYFSQKASVYVVTNQRAIRFGRFWRTSWRAPELEFIDREEGRNGRGSLFFATTSTGKGGTRLVGFENLDIHDLPAAERALKALYERA
jgi:hypothetical protein